MTDNVLILGARGRLGFELVKAFAGRGWKVRAQVRTSGQADVLTSIPGAVKVTPIVADAEGQAALAEAAKGCAVVVNALNPLYTEWARHARELGQGAIRAAREAGATLLFPGNVYGFGPDLPAVLPEELPSPGRNTRKGAVRQAMESDLLAASREGEQVAIIRAGDFYGGGPGSWFDLAIARSLRKGVVTYPGPLDVEHAWAYLPDLAQVFVDVAERRGQLPPFSIFNFPGHAITGRELIAALERVAGRSLATKGMPWGMMKALSPLVPMWRELVEMRYLWEKPHRLEGRGLLQLLGGFRSTPLDEALKGALETLEALPAQQQAS